MTLTEDLLTLFRVDRQVRGLRGRLASAERYLQAQDHKLDELGVQQEELAHRRQQVQATVANLETEGAGIDERTEKLREELNNASTNKQYTAVLTELNTVKLSRSELDDRLLEEMEQIDRIAEQIAQLKDQAAERRKVREVAEAQLQERQGDVGQRLAELQTEHDSAAAGIPDHDLTVFNRLADIHDGEAMAPIEEIDRRHREYACGACNMHMPFEAVSLLLGATESLVMCSACGRILYMQDEIRGAFAKK